MVKDLMENKYLQHENLLIITFSYTPRLNPRAFRWSSVAQEFVKRGAKVNVITSWQPGLASHQNIEGVNVYRVGISILERCRHLLTGQSNNYDYLNCSDKNIKPKHFFGELSNAFNTYWRQLAWPDTTCVWVIPAIRKAMEIIRKSPTLNLLCVTPSFSSSLVGAFIKSRYRGIKYFMDMGDPFSFAYDSPANNFKIYHWLNNIMERKIFNSSNAIILTNHNAKRIYSKLYPETRTKIKVIPPLLTTKKMGAHNSNRKLGSLIKTTEIIYVGTLYKKIRRPEFLLRLFIKAAILNKKHNAILHFYGNTSECHNAFEPFSGLIGDRIMLHGPVPQKVAHNAICRSDVLINIGNNNNYQLPSKLIEYAAAKKKIINIYTCDTDASLHYLKGYHSVLNLHDTGKPPNTLQVGQTLDFINKKINKNKDLGHNKWIEQHSIQNISKRYAKILFD